MSTLDPQPRRPGPAPTIDPIPRKSTPFPPVSVVPRSETPKPAARATDPPGAPGSEEIPRLGSPRESLAVLVRIWEGGADGEVVPLGNLPLVLGRADGECVFAADSLLSGRHCSIRLEGQRAMVRDLGSRNGTFVRRSDRVTITEGMETLFGNTLVRWSLATGVTPPAPPESGRTVEYGDATGSLATVRAAVVRGRNLTADECVFRGSGTIGRTGQTLALRDPFVSPVHARVDCRSEAPWLKDADSVNGCWIRLAAESDWPLQSGDAFRAGKQIFRFELRS